MPKIQFRILTLIILTTVVAICVTLLMPFEPKMAFSTPSWYRNTDFETGEEFDIASITVTNTSLTPFWVRGTGRSITTYWVHSEPPDGNITGHGSHAQPFSWNLMYRGDSAAITFPPSVGWDMGIIELEVSDWRGRKAWYKSKPISLARPSTPNTPP